MEFSPWPEVTRLHAAQASESASDLSDPATVERLAAHTEPDKRHVMRSNLSNEFIDGAKGVEQPPGAYDGKWGEIRRKSSQKRGY